MKKRKLARRLVAAAASAVVLLAMALVLAGCSCSSEQPAPQKVAVPDVEFMAVGDARAAIEQSGLTVGEVTFTADDKVPLGTVITQDPVAATEVDAGTAVSLDISTGSPNPAIVSVPDLTGKNKDEAEKALTAINLIPVSGDPVYSDVEPGKVCQQSLKPGSQAKEGDRVTFCVSLGKKTVAVPDETGKTYDDAKADLDAIDLGVDKATAYDDQAPEGTVMSQSIAAGTTVTEGTTVTLTVSLGVKPPDQVTVPDIMTYTLDDAINALESAGLNYTYSGDEDGTVSAMDPDAGTQVDVGSTVKFTLTSVAPVPTGEWTYNGVAASSISDDEQAIFDQAAGSSGLEPIAVLATQVVAGTNYAFLCDSGYDWHVIAIGVDTDGNASMINDAAIDITNVMTTDAGQADSYTAGSWEVPDAPSATLKPQDAAQAFDTAMAGYTGVGITPLATLATQLVDGTNYLIVGIGAPVTDGAPNQVYATVVNAAPDGTASFVDVSLLDLAQYLP